jgi:hypothetical protein
MFQIPQMVAPLTAKYAHQKSYRPTGKTLLPVRDVADPVYERKAEPFAGSRKICRIHIDIQQRP